MKRFTLTRHFPSAKVNTTQIVTSLLASPQAIPKLKKTRIFISSLMEGKKSKEARVEAGYGVTTPTRAILSTAAGKMALVPFVQDRFKPPRVIKKLDYLWDAKIRRPFKVGDDVEWHEVPDHDTQVKALDRVLKLQGHLKEDDGKKDQPATTIQFLIVGGGANVSPGSGS